MANQINSFKKGFNHNKLKTNKSVKFNNKRVKDSNQLNHPPSFLKQMIFSTWKILIHVGKRKMQKTSS